MGSPPADLSAVGDDVAHVALTGTPVELRVTRPMGTLQMFSRALPRLAFRSQGRLDGSRPLGGVRVRQAGLQLEPTRIESYREVCAYRAEPGLVPLPYPEIHFTPLMPSRVRLDVASLQPGEGARQILVRDPQCGAPYLVGECGFA